MTFIAIHKPANMTAALYEQTVVMLDEAGMGNPKGRLFHTCYLEKGSLCVTDVWDTEDNFRRFGETLVPILMKLGIEGAEPEIHPLHNFISGM